MAFALHPLLSTYPGASFVPNGNLTGPHLALASGGDSAGYWGHVPLLPPPLPQPLYPQHQPEPLYPQDQHQPLYPQDQHQPLYPQPQPQPLYPQRQHQPLYPPHQPQPLYPPHQAQPLYLENQAQTLHLHPAILGLQSPWSWNLPPAVVAAHEGRGTGMYGLLPEQLERGAKGAAFNYGWPRYGPMPLKPELGGFVGKINPYGRSFPHGYYKTTY